jgi:hypothetical protein
LRNHHSTLQRLQQRGARRRGKSRADARSAPDHDDTLPPSDVAASVITERNRPGDLSHGEVVKHIRHPLLGPIAFEYSAFAVDGRPDLSMVVYNPATPADAEKIRSLTV